jgi:hypothetical protein
MTSARQHEQTFMLHSTSRSMSFEHEKQNTDLSTRSLSNASVRQLFNSVDQINIDVDNCLSTFTNREHRSNVNELQTLGSSIVRLQHQINMSTNPSDSQWSSTEFLQLKQNTLIRLSTLANRIDSHCRESESIPKLTSPMSTFPTVPLATIEKKQDVVPLKSSLTRQHSVSTSENDDSVDIHATSSKRILFDFNSSTTNK